jgi:hypothetical protein
MAVGWDDEGNELFFDARATLLSQYANSPIITALVGALNIAGDKQVDYDAFYDFVWNVETAVGFGLDIWGRIVGVSRTLHLPSPNATLGFAGTGLHTFGYGVFGGGGTITTNYDLDDLVYRRVILAKAALNITNNSIPAVNAILMALFPGYGNVYVADNNNMTITFTFGSTPSTIDYTIITQSGVVPKPIGVAMSVTP